ncbi:hypothetical protein Bbelb_002540 [Branchiostoma belcheri]|nr:hypothetical protein Bbelb_002540 [Branchiostoma belcheri]
MNRHRDDQTGFHYPHLPRISVEPYLAPTIERCVAQTIGNSDTANNDIFSRRETSLAHNALPFITKDRKRELEIEPGVGNDVASISCGTRPLWVDDLSFRAPGKRHLEKIIPTEPDITND